MTLKATHSHRNCRYSRGYYHVLLLVCSNNDPISCTVSDILPYLQCSWLHVTLSVGLSPKVSPTETAETIEMPFAWRTRVSPENHLLDISELFQPNTAVWAFHTIQSTSVSLSAQLGTWSSTWRETSRLTPAPTLVVQSATVSSEDHWTRLRTVGDRSFAAAAACVWNDLPVTVTSAATVNKQ